MRHTPRANRASPSGSSGRGIGTLIGNGWLREQPRQNGGWLGNGRWQDIRSKSALRKCMFMAVPDEVRALMPPAPQGAAPYVAPPRPAVQRSEDVPAHRRNPQRDVRQFAAYVPPPNARQQQQQLHGGMGPVVAAHVDPRVLAAQAHAYHVQNAQRAAAAAAAKAPSAWWEDPVALGSLLILAPPIGLAAVWASKRYSSDARWALTIMTALTMCLMSAILIASFAIR